MQRESLLHRLHKIKEQGPCFKKRSKPRVTGSRFSRRARVCTPAACGESRLHWGLLPTRPRWPRGFRDVSEPQPGRVRLCHRVSPRRGSRGCDSLGAHSRENRPRRSPLGQQYLRSHGLPHPPRRQPGVARASTELAARRGGRGWMLVTPQGSELPRDLSAAPGPHPPVTAALPPPWD